MAFVYGQSQRARDKPGDKHSMTFLLAEYELIRHARESALDLVESRIKFVVTLQTAEIALVGVLLARANVDTRAIGLIALAVGTPTLILSHIVYLRALDFQIQGRKYLRALNAIRAYFVLRDPELQGAVLLSTNRKKPAMSSVGEGSGLILSLAVTMLVLTSFALGALASEAIWLSTTVSSIGDPDRRLIIAVLGGAVTVLLYVLVQTSAIRRRLRRAEET